ncbi:MAG TPA: serine hydrolase domain-containing protein [Jatrophihabitantaceae bacterium]|jgi:CubicO group peptidase (beta-lactamase class C family)|nr:serine hydrolase domain-containing protein [Jatrophihabitantaceae bacterium]
MSDALDAVGEWPVDTAAAAIVDRTGVIATYGPADQQFAIASLTKPLAALAILVAVEEEAVSLNDPADERLIPGATLRHLLSHASGYAPDRPMKAAAPATRRIYSNVGIERAAALVAEATDIEFPDYLAEAVLGPLQMADTELPGSAARDGISTTADLARMVHELLAPTGLLAAATLADLSSVQFPGLRGVLPGFGAQDPNDWGLGFEIRAHKSPHWTGARNSPRTYGHFGQRGTMLWIDPDAQLGLVALTDRDFGPWAAEVWPALADAVLS